MIVQEISIKIHDLNLERCLMIILTCSAKSFKRLVEIICRYDYVINGFNRIG